LVPYSTTQLAEKIPLKNTNISFDLLGRETKYEPNTPLFYIYDDRTVDKILTIE